MASSDNLHLAPCSNGQPNCLLHGGFELSGDLGPIKLFKRKRKTGDDQERAASPLPDEVAVKRHRLKNGPLDDAAAAVAALKDLSHPNVVKFYILVLNKNEGLCLAMDKCLGSLYDMLDVRGLSVAEMGTVGHQMLDGLEYLHSNRVSHGNLKATNVLAKPMVDLGTDQWQFLSPHVICFKLTDYGLPGSAAGEDSISAIAEWQDQVTADVKAFGNLIDNIALRDVLKGPVAQGKERDMGRLLLDLKHTQPLVYALREKISSQDCTASMLLQEPLFFLNKPLGLQQDPLPPELPPTSCGDHRKCIMWETSSIFSEKDETTIAALIAEGKDLFVAGFDSVRILDVQSFDCKQIVKTNHEDIRCIDVSKEQVILGCTHKQLVTLWNRSRDGLVRLTTTTFQHGIVCTKLGSTYAMVCTSGDDYNFSLISLQDGSVSHTINNGHYLDPNGALWISPNKLLTCGNKGQLLLYKINIEPPNKWGKSSTSVQTNEIALACKEKSPRSLCLSECGEAFWIGYYHHPKILLQKLCLSSVENGYTSEILLEIPHTTPEHKSAYHIVAQGQLLLVVREHHFLNNIHSLTAFDPLKPDHCRRVWTKEIGRRKMTVAGNMLFYTNMKCNKVRTMGLDLLKEDIDTITESAQDDWMKEGA